MEEEKRERHMDYAEERDDFPEDRMDEEEMRERPGEYRDGTDIFVEETVDEELHRSEQAVDSNEETPFGHEHSTMVRELVPLLRETELDEFRSQWQDIQTNFVDDPSHSVERADELVARVINSITENFADERDSLEEQWNRGEEASTEDLRIAIKRYRSFFNRLLTLESMGIEKQG